MSVEQMRNHLYDAYPGDKWRRKVEQMTDKQVVAVYFSILHRK